MLYIYKVKPGNFGDDLNSSIVPHYLGLKDNEYEELFLDDVRAKEELNDNDVVLISIGTILNKQIPVKGRKIIIGAGTGYGELPYFDSLYTINFVRGPKTAEQIGSNCQYITDPGILTAEFYHNLKDENVNRERIGYIPHHGCASQEWSKLCDKLGLYYIDPRREPEAVISDIASCNKIITEAMHGAIVADAFRVPWVATYSAEKINHFKWEDWCESMHLTYKPFQLFSLWPTNGRIMKGLKNSIFSFLNREKIKRIISDSSLFTLSTEEVYLSKKEQVKSSLKGIANLI